MALRALGMAILVATLLAVGCVSSMTVRQTLPLGKGPLGSPDWARLQDGVHTAEDVEGAFGPPSKVGFDQAGQHVWRYQYVVTELHSVKVPLIYGSERTGSGLLEFVCVFREGVLVNHWRESK